MSTHSPGLPDREPVTRSTPVGTASLPPQPSAESEGRGESERLLGDLIDALSDELRHEVSQCPEVMDVIFDACAVLGENYHGYRAAW